MSHLFGPKGNNILSAFTRDGITTFENARLGAPAISAEESNPKLIHYGMHSGWRLIVAAKKKDGIGTPKSLEPREPKVPPDEDDPPSSNGCSGGAPDLWWGHCCDGHDMCYGRGGGPVSRSACDLALRACINWVGGPGNVYWSYVRSFGCSRFSWHGTCKRDCGFMCMQECIDYARPDCQNPSQSFRLKCPLPQLHGPLKSPILAENTFRGGGFDFAGSLERLAGR